MKCTCDFEQPSFQHNTHHLLYIYSILPDDELQICPKHVEADWWNKLRINSASSWFLLHRFAIVYFIYKTSKSVSTCMNLTLRWLRVTTVAIESNKCYGYWVCVFSLPYPTCKAYAPCYIFILASPVLQYFSSLSHKWQDFREEVIEFKMCFEFLYKFRLKLFPL